MKIVDDFPAGAHGAARSGAKERQDGRWLGDLERAWLANWAQFSGQAEDKRPEANPPPQDRFGASPIAAGRSASARQPTDASLAGSTASVPADRTDERSRPMAAERLSSDRPPRRDVPGTVPPSPVSQANASHGVRPQPSVPHAEPGAAHAPADSMANAPPEARAPWLPQAESMPTGEKPLERLEADTAATPSNRSVAANDATKPPQFEASSAVVQRPATPPQARAASSIEKPSAAEPSIRNPMEAGTQLAGPGRGEPEKALSQALEQAPASPIAHLAPAYFADQLVGADAAGAAAELDPFAQASAAASPAQLSVAQASLARSASGDAFQVATPAVAVKAGSAHFGMPGVASAAEPRRPESQREGPEEPGHPGAAARLVTTTQGPLPDKTSMNVSTGGEVAQVTVRDSSLSGDEVLRVGHMLALQLKQLGFSSVKTYVNGVASRMDSAHGSQALATEAKDAITSEPTPQGKVAK